MDGVPPRVPTEVETAIKAAVANPNRTEATLLLASIANRAAAALHQVARSQASARKGQADWGQWAALANISRDAILRTAASRQSATQLAKAFASESAIGVSSTDPQPTNDDEAGRQPTP